MPRFKWHAHYFDGTGSRAVRKTIIEADYGDEAEKIAEAQMGLYDRVEVSRVATSAPARGPGQAGGATVATDRSLSS